MASRMFGISARRFGDAKNGAERFYCEIIKRWEIKITL